MYAGSCQWLHSTGVTVGYVMAAGMSHILLKGGTCQCMAPCHNVIQVNTNNYCTDKFFRLLGMLHNNAC